MHPKAPKLLEDIRDAAAFVADSVRGLTGSEYEANRLLRQAVERNFEIIGEALIRLAQVDAETASHTGPVAQIKAFRNILVHAYDSIDHQIVWDVIQTKLPVLLQNVKQLLADAKGTKRPARKKPTPTKTAKKKSAKKPKGKKRKDD